MTILAIHCSPLLFAVRGEGVGARTRQVDSHDGNKEALLSPDFDLMAANTNDGTNEQSQGCPERWTNKPTNEQAG